MPPMGLALKVCGGISRRQFSRRYLYLEGNFIETKPRNTLHETHAVKSQSASTSLGTPWASLRSCLRQSKHNFRQPTLHLQGARADTTAACKAIQGDTGPCLNEGILLLFPIPLQRPKDPNTKKNPKDPSKKPIVTYISRQTTGRRLTDESHEGLVRALRELEEEGICEVRIPVMERLSLGEQVAEVASSTVSIPTFLLFWCSFICSFVRSFVRPAVVCVFAGRD